MSLIDSFYATLETAVEPKDLFIAYGRLVLAYMNGKAVSDTDIEKTHDPITKKFGDAMLAYIRRQGVAYANGEYVKRALD